jgi:hypothetical protein
MFEGGDPACESVRPNPARRHSHLISLAVWALFAAVFAGLVVVRWPSIFSFVAFGFRDQGSFVTLESLTEKHLRLGVDVGYTYGLLPVLLQHVFSPLLGRGYRLILGFGVAHLAAMAVFWTLLWRRLGMSLEVLTAVVLLSPLAAISVPVPAQALLQLSIVFGLLCLLAGRLPEALVIALIGWLSVPSLTIVLTVLVCGWMVPAWWGRPQPRGISVLLGWVLPGLAASAGLVLLLGFRFGWDSLWSTILPTGGAAVYRAMHFGIFADGWHYLHPPGARLGYYLGTKVGWWILGTLLLTLVAARAATQMWSESRVSGLGAFVVSCWVLHVAFILVAFGSGYHTMYYDPILVAGVLAGLSTVSARPLRMAALASFVALGVLGQTTAFREARRDWTDSHRFPSTGFLYAPASFESEWRPILEAASTQKVLLLSYGNGVREFFPQVTTPNSWFLLPGLLKDREHRELLAQIREADVVAEELGETTRLIDDDPDIQTALARFPRRTSGASFRVWQR